jgi:hypothetical protein
VLLALADDGSAQPIPQIVRQFEQLGVTIDLDGSFGGVANHITVMAPLQMIFQLNAGALIYRVVQVVRKLL